MNNTDTSPEYPHQCEWTLQEGIKLARTLEAFAITIGYHIALGGSVLHKGTSSKDLDIFVYPHDSGNKTLILSSGELLAQFTKVGISVVKAKNELYPCRIVHITEYEGKRVDLFFLQ